ncbi:M48 family metallopeptidase [Kangiella sediminilitoris]|uniref:Peptidase n=1 Tax=Kangiella sediminilitoris TaxID=1144748 RepID=A0A1B3BD86_9GAMM|nr:M48 family metallopeptidase [Kangiella sediminilitoris]AOE50772.1 peptidase [Kangiella sediminilitoris]
MRKPYLAGITALLLTACATSPTGRDQVLIFSESQMAEMGAASFTSMKESQKIDTNRAHNRYVNCVVDALIPELNRIDPKMRSTRWETQVFVDDSANAFALPGGKIGVHTGMFKVAENSSQLAAVIGHEIGHVWARHGNARVSSQFITSTGLQLAAIAAGEPTQEKKQLLGLLGVGAQVGVLLPFSRGDESEADEIGIELMAKAGFDPRESVELWKNMAKQGSGGAPELLSTHPAPQTRISKLQALMEDSMSDYRQARSEGKNPNCSL